MQEIAETEQAMRFDPKLVAVPKLKRTAKPGRVIDSQCEGDGPKDRSAGRNRPGTASFPR